MVTHSSQSPQSWCWRWLCPPCRPWPPLCNNTELSRLLRWKEICFWAMMMLYICFELHNIILKALLSGVFVMKAHNLTSKYRSPPSRPGLSSTICTIFWSRCSNHRTPQRCLWSQRGSGKFSLWQQLQWEEEQDKSLPGEGKGGIVQVALAGKTSMSVRAPEPPAIIRPAQWKL